jgi:hypothetical protein
MVNKRKNMAKTSLISVQYSADVFVTLRIATKITDYEHIL